MGGTMTKLLPGLYVGGWRNANDEAALELNGITHILSVIDVRKDLPKVPHRKYLKFHLCDTPEEKISHLFSQTNDFIHEARKSGGVCLVHCLAGVSRSVSVCVAYVMTVFNLGADEALGTVRGFRHAANPNYGFYKQLKAFQAEDLVRERQRFLEVHGEWCHLERDLEVQRRGLSNYQQFLETGFYGSMTVDGTEDDREEENAKETGNSSSSSSDTKQNTVKKAEVYIIPHTDYNEIREPEKSSLCVESVEVSPEEEVDYRVVEHVDHLLPMDIGDGGEAQGKVDPAP